MLLNQSRIQEFLNKSLIQKQQKIIVAIYVTVQYMIWRDIGVFCYILQNYGTKASKRIIHVLPTARAAVHI